MILRVTPLLGRNACKVKINGEGWQGCLLAATLNNVEPLIVWSCHLHQVADAVIEADKGEADETGSVGEKRAPVSVRT